MSELGTEFNAHRFSGQGGPTCSLQGDTKWVSTISFDSLSRPMAAAPACPSAVRGRKLGAEFFGQPTQTLSLFILQLFFLLPS